MAKSSRPPCMDQLLGLVTYVWRVRIVRDLKSSAALLLVMVLGLLVFGSFTTFYHVLLLGPLALPEGDRLTQILHILVDEEPLYLEHFTGSEYRALKDHLQGFDTLFALGDGGKDSSVVVVFEDQVERVPAARVTGDFWAGIGVPPWLGSFSGDHLSQLGHKVWVSHSLWSSHLGASEAVLGTTLEVDGATRWVAGVLSPDLDDEATRLLFGRQVDLWIPMEDEASGIAENDRSLRVFGRWAEDRNFENLELSGVEGVLPGEIQLISKPLRETATESIRPVITRLCTIGVLVLILSHCSALALVLARGLRNAKTVHVCKALGISPRRLLGESLVEGLLLGLATGCMAAVLFGPALKVLGRLLSADVPNISTVVPSSGSAVLLAGLGVLSGVILGAVSGVQLRFGKSGTPLRLGSNSPSAPLVGALRLIVNLEVASVFAALVGASLLYQSTKGLVSENLNMNTEQVLLADVHRPILDRTRFSEVGDVSSEGKNLFYQQFKDRLASIPSVVSVALASSPPLRERDYRFNGWVLRKIDEDYFGLLETPLLLGRNLDRADGTAAEINAVVNQEFADAFFGDLDPVGATWERFRIVGVVASSRHRAIDARAAPALYVHYQRIPDDRLSVLLRTAGPPMELASMVKREARLLDRGQPVSAISTLESLRDQSARLRRSRLFWGLASCLSLVGLVLAFGGINGLTGILEASRLKEYAIRIALGASIVQLGAVAVRDNLALFRRGLAWGLGGSLVVIISIRDLLYDVAPINLKVFFGAAVALGLMVVVVSFVHYWKMVPRSLAKGGLRCE